MVFRLLAFTFSILFMLSALAQDAVPGEILGRTFMIHAGNEQATCFTLDYQGKLFLVTARHVVAGMPTDGAVIQLRQNGEWKDLHVSKILFPSSDDVDIAVLKTDQTIPQPFGVTASGELNGVTMGQQVWFLGYPFLEGLSSHWNGGGEAPFIKRGTMSAIVATNPDAIVLYIDGFNNKGFSGGPILYWSFSAHAYRILGVVKGYRNDHAQTVINGQQVDTNLLVIQAFWSGTAFNTRLMR
jgi:hypothetical protein